MLVSTVYSVLSPESCEKISQACYSGGIGTHNPPDAGNSRAIIYGIFIIAYSDDDSDSFCDSF